MELTLKKAFEESIRKWKIVIEENNGTGLGIEQSKQLGFIDYLADCALCEKYCGKLGVRFSNEPWKGTNYCPLCPLSPLYRKKYDAKYARNCCKEYQNWGRADYENKPKYAKIMLAKIEKLYEERYG